MFLFFIWLLLYDTFYSTYTWNEKTRELTPLTLLPCPFPTYYSLFPDFSSLPSRAPLSPSASPNPRQWTQAKTLLDTNAYLLLAVYKLVNIWLSVLKLFTLSTYLPFVLPPSFTLHCISCSLCTRFAWTPRDARRACSMLKKQKNKTHSRACWHDHGERTPFYPICLSPCCYLNLCHIRENRGIYVLCCKRNAT